MDKLIIPDNTAPFVHALRELIRTGAMASPTLESSCLIELPVVAQRSGPDASPAKRAHTFTQILQQIINQRLQGKDAQTATILFGFDSFAGVPIQDRYREVAKLYNPHWTWENYRKEPLTRHLLAVYLALEREAEIAPVAPHFGNQPKQARSGLVGQDWVLERFDGVYSLPSRPDQPLEVMVTRRLRAICDTGSTWRCNIQWRERGVSKLPQVTLLSPGTVTVTDRHFDHATGMRIYMLEVTFPQPVHYGQSVEFTLITHAAVKYDQIVPDKGWDWYGLIKLASPTEHARIGIRFPPHKYPHKVWRYQDLISGLIHPGTPTDENRLTIDSSGYVSCSWSDLSAGYSYGISWDW